MAKQTKQLSEVNVTLRTFKTKLFFLKEIGADVKVVPKNKKLKRLWAIAHGQISGGFGSFGNSKKALKTLRDRLSNVSIDLEARYFGRPINLPNPIELEGGNQQRRCDKFLCRVRHRAIGIFVKINSEGISGADSVKLDLSRVTARAIVNVGSEQANLKIS